MSDTPKKLIVDIAKGTSEYIDLTPGEIAERDQQAAQAEVDRRLNYKGQEGDTHGSKGPYRKSNSNT
jgi:hypothetical protein